MADGSGEVVAMTPGQRALWRWFRLAGVPVVALLLIALAVVLLNSRASDGAVPVKLGIDDAGGAAPELGKLAPDFELTAADGVVYRLSDLRGRAVMINFWATWCGPCKSEMPAMEEAHKQLAGERLIILAVNVQEERDLIDPFVRRLGLTFPILLDSSGAVSRRYRVTGLPTTYLIRADGTIDGIRVGAYTRAMLTGRLEQLIDE